MNKRREEGIKERRDIQIEVSERSAFWIVFSGPRGF